MMSLDTLHRDITVMHTLGLTPEYYAKQMHHVPLAPVVDRVAYIVQHCQGKRILHLGCSSGGLHAEIAKVATDLEGWDSELYHGPAHHKFCQLDFEKEPDRVDSMCAGSLGDFDLVVLGEILEHIGNPGTLLISLREIQCQILITVPNAFSAVARKHLSGGIENVHTQHVAWYSWRTLRTLVERYGYTVEEFTWYNCPKNAQPHEAEGLIMLVR